MTVSLPVSLSLCIKETSQVDRHDSGRCDMFNMCVILQIPLNAFLFSPMSVALQNIQD